MNNPHHSGDTLFIPAQRDNRSQDAAKTPHEVLRESALGLMDQWVESGQVNQSQVRKSHDGRFRGSTAGNMDELSIRVDSDGAVGIDMSYEDTTIDGARRTKVLGVELPVQDHNWTAELHREFSVGENADVKEGWRVSNVLQGKESVYAVHALASVIKSKYIQ